MSNVNLYVVFVKLLGTRKWTRPLISWWVEQLDQLIQWYLDERNIPCHAKAPAAIGE